MVQADHLFIVDSRMTVYCVVATLEGLTMHTTHELIELAKQRLSLAHNLPLPMTDYRLGKLLKIKQATISNWRTGKTGIGSEFAQIFASACELSPEYIYACIQHERAKNAQERSILERIASQFRGAAAVIVAAGMMLALPCFTGSNDANAVVRDIHYAQRRRRSRCATGHSRFALTSVNSSPQGDTHATTLPIVGRNFGDGLREQRTTHRSNQAAIRACQTKAGRSTFCNLHEAGARFIRRLQEQRRAYKSSRNLSITIAALALSGCSTLHDPAELSWQALHGADIAMTDHIVNDDCYNEGAPLTRALIGANPSHADVATWGIGTAALHLGVSHMLKDSHPTAYKVWQAITIVDTAASIGKGWSIGVRFGGTNKRQNCGAALSRPADLSH